MAEAHLHWWPKVQISGSGLTLMAAFGPTLDIPIPYALRLGAFVLGGVMVIWPLVVGIWENVGPATWTPEGRVAAGKLRATVAVLALCTFLGGGYASLHWRRIEPKPIPPPIVSASPPLPPKPWVTAEEIAAQQKLGHVLLKFRPDAILTTEAEGQSTQLYLNNWIKIDYPTATTPTPYTYKKKAYTAVVMTEVPLASGFPTYIRSEILALFDPKKATAELLGIGVGDRLKAYCRIQEIVPGTPSEPYKIRTDLMVVDECEFP